MNPLRVIPLGGLGEIGMNCMVLETQDDIIVIDCGILFSDLDHFGVEFIIPDFTYLKERKDKLRAFVITHGHEDHVGALPFALKAGLDAPIFASPFASMLIRERLKEHGLEHRADLRTFKMGSTFDVAGFKIQTVSVNHSIVDSAALIIDTPAGKIIHTGDFKIDPTPFYGNAIDLDVFSKAGEEGVLLLMSDSTNVERHTHSLSESVIYQKFEQLFAAAEGLTLVAMFASNISRMGQVFDVVKKLNKKIALSGRGIEQNVRLSMEAGYLQGADANIIPLDDLSKYPRKDIVVLSTGSQGEYRSSLIRIAMGEHSKLAIQPGDTVLMSSKFIPGNEKAIGRMINQLFKQGAEVLYEAVHDIHVSGHATKPELKEMLTRVQPKFFVPIHGEYRHLVHHSRLALETHIPTENIHLAINGDVIQLTPDTCEIVEHLDDTRVLIENREGHDISKIVLRERRHLGEKGVIFALLVRNAETGRIISGPEIITKGLADEIREPKLILDSKTLVKKIVGRYETGLDQHAPEMDLQECIRVELRRFYLDQIGKKPTVLPVVLDL